MSYLPLFILSLISLVILSSACFNYTNLSIARALRRAREIGIRKVIGAQRQQIILQILLESTMVALFALSLGIGIFYFIRPGFFRLLPNASYFTLAITPILLAGFMGFALLAGLLAGIFPAIFLAQMRPALVLKNMATQKLFKQLTARKVLVVFQFVLSIGFIVGTSIILKQHQFAIQRDLGFAKTNILNIDLQGVDAQIFKQEFSKIPAVENVSFASTVVGGNNTAISWVKKEDGKDSLASVVMSVDEQYLNIHQIPLLAGVNFSTESAVKAEQTLIVNEVFLNRYGWETKEAAIGEWVYLQNIPHQIIGVVKDFHYAHLEEPIRAFCFQYHPKSFEFSTLKVTPNKDFPTMLAQFEDTWVQLSKQPLSFKFLDVQIEENYQFLQHIMTLFSFIASLAISIACLGLLGMVVYTTETRLKEISIRKIFGASIPQLIFNLSKGIGVLILIAALIATPLTYILFDQVILNNFAYRIQIGPIELLSGFMFVLLLGIVTIGSQTWKAANTNPAENLSQT